MKRGQHKPKPTTVAPLQVVQALQSKQTTLESLQERLGIQAVHHPTLPLVILNYHQIASPKTHPMVRECRSLCLEKTTWKLVARSFHRFFNWGEVREEQDDFNFDNFRVDSKEDGSIITIYHYNGGWHANTRQSFGLRPAAAVRQQQQAVSYTWRQLVCQALGIHDLDDLDSILTPGYSYVCELTSPYNKVVRSYPDTCLFLLAVFDARGVEQSPLSADRVAASMGAKRPITYSFSSLASIQSFLDTQRTADPTFEGVVICDNAHRRWKIKNPSFLLLHKRIGDVSSSVTSPQFLLPFVLKGERSELLTYYPETQEVFDKTDKAVQRELDALLQLWEQCRGLEGQRDFAQAVLGQASNKSMSSILFRVRKDKGGAQDVEQIFRSEEQLVLGAFFLAAL
ncbi:RNA ligase [Seminavis robusta]|uniref:RNA ligase n=1 Tax=Seminavis robusta TaxID=568900 RepID=A0A9N8HWV5_9STRA|nr:RNA ligase [Seminavis robusta]|eukprot:Sro1705_g292450.1 RNA ligase (398) ;mRNA; f:12881-14074